MVCPYCSSPTSVINSRLQKRNNKVWRRRRCDKCQATFTTHESIDLPSVFSVSKERGKEPFNSELLFREVVDSLRGHERPYETAREITATITQNVLKSSSNGLISPEKISSEAAGVLKKFDKQAYLRFIAEHPSVQP